MTDDDVPRTDTPIVFTMPSLRADDAPTQIVSAERARTASATTPWARLLTWLRLR